MGKRFNRLKQVTRMRLKLERESFPRCTMFFLMTLTGLSGLLCSYMLLHAGMHSMTLRYLIAVIVAYGVLMLLLWLWMRSSADDYVDIADPNLLPGRGSSRATTEIYKGEGGGFGGGGSSASYNPATASSPDSSGLDTVGDIASGAASADEMAIPLFLIIGALMVMLSSLWIVYTAPVLMAELMVDGALVAGLYHHISRKNRRHWLQTAVKRTIWPFVITALVLTLAAAMMETRIPEAGSIGEFLSIYNQHNNN